MIDTSIILFGKADSFESFEIIPSKGVTKIVDAFIEPAIKVSSSQKEIIHYFINDDKSYLQLYSFAQAKHSARDGVVIGIAFKSSKILTISTENYRILKHLLEIFKEKSLNDYVFKSNSIEPSVREISNSIINFITKLEYKEGIIKVDINKPLILYSPHFEGNFKNLRPEVYTVKDVYISSDKDVFSSNLNSLFMHSVNNKFYVLNTENKGAEYGEMNESEIKVGNFSKDTDDSKLKNTGDDFSPHRFDSLKNDFFKYVERNDENIKKLKALTILNISLVCILIIKNIYEYIQPNKETPTVTSTRTIKTQLGNKIAVALPSPNNSTPPQKETLEFPQWDRKASNEFRKWVNAHYPVYAKKNKLDKTGSSDNPIIKKAWEDYGKEFSEGQ